MKNNLLFLHTIYQLMLYMNITKRTVSRRRINKTKAIIINVCVFDMWTLGDVDATVIDASVSNRCSKASVNLNITVITG